MLLYLNIIQFSFLKYFSYPWEFFAVIAKQALQIVFLIFFWSLVIEGVEGQRLIDLASYFLIANGIKDLIMFDRRNWGRFLRKNIESGQLNIYLMRPVKLLPYTFSIVVGEGFLNLFISIIYIVIGLFISPSSSLVSIFLFFMYLINAILISLAINLFEGALSLVYTKVTGVFNSLNHVSRVFFWCFNTSVSLSK